MAKKKEKVEAPKQPVKNAAYYEKALANLQKDKDTMQRQYESLLKKGELSRLKYKEAHDILEARLERALEDKEYWFQAGDKAHKENETVVEDIKELVDETISTILAVHELTGEISPVDVVYNVTMIDRIIQAKYNPKTEEF